MGFVGWGGVAVALFGMFRCCGSCGEAPQLCCGSQQACYRFTLFSQPLLVQAVLGEHARDQPCAVLCCAYPHCPWALLLLQSLMLLCMLSLYLCCLGAVDPGRRLCWDPGCAAAGLGGWLRWQGGLQLPATKGSPAAQPVAPDVIQAHCGSVV